MDEGFYESLLKKHDVGKLDPQARWDAHAAGFKERLKASPNDHAQKTTMRLLGKDVLQGKVLDIGGGTGRYAIPFAAHVGSVTVADISPEMLKVTEENAETAGRANVKCVHLNWETANLQALDWEHRFDLTFASMCPAVMSKAGIDKMTAASRGWCQINQLIEMTDDLSQLLTKELAMEKTYDPHNDRDAVQGIFNFLWIQGYEPEITYLKDSRIRALPADETIASYTRRFGKAAADKNTDLLRLLANHIKGDKIIVTSKTTLALILWKA